ncbi:MAG: hypothetical protein KBD06_02000 [Candidatus Pacebacteria bacterium]|nr:hypothetical protein [Candidatus Paceibacterota bacterium]
MTVQLAITLFSVIAFISGLYLLLTCLNGPHPKRRFAIGIICMLGGGLISIYQFTHL